MKNKAITPALIVLRIIRGYGWSNEVVKRLQTRYPVGNHDTHDFDVSLNAVGVDSSTAKNSGASNGVIWRQVP